MKLSYRGSNAITALNKYRLDDIININGSSINNKFLVLIIQILK